MSVTLTTQNQWYDLGTGSFSGLSNCGVKLQGRWTSQDADGSNVEFRVVTTGSGYWRTSSGSNKFTGFYTNSKSLANYPNYTYSGTTILSKSGYIRHEADGTKSIKLGATGSINTGSTNTYTISQQTIILPTINKASRCSIDTPTFTIGDDIHITITQYIDSYHQDLYIKIGGTEHLLKARATGTEEIETSLLANTFYQAMGSVKTLSGQVKLYTYDSNDQQVGSAQTADYTANIDEAIVYPTFDVTYTDTNATTTAITGGGDQPDIIQNQSTLQINVTNATATSYATGLSTIAVTINGTTTTESISSATHNITLGTQDLANDTLATITLTDSRGLSHSEQLTLSVLAWVTPSAVIDLKRQQNFYTETDIKVDANYSSLDGNNTITIQYRTKKNGGSWGTWTNLSDNVTSTFNADNTYEWDVEVKVTDLLGSKTYTGLKLSKGIPKFFVDTLRSSTGVNCFPDYDNALQVDGNAYVSGNIYSGGSPIIDSGYISTGNTGYYIKYADGTMITRHTAEGSASITTTWGSGYTTGSTNTISLGNFPVAFLAGTTPYVWITPVRNGYNYWCGTCNGTDPTTAGVISLLRFTSASINYRLRVLAIGRWK